VADSGRFQFRPERISNTTFGLLHERYSGRTFLAGKEVRYMDTMTYASVAMLPRSIAEEHTHFVGQDLDLLPLDLSMIKR
jgi:hypothetical protein